jgi:hypothetical protein
MMLASRRFILCKRAMILRYPVHSRMVCTQIIEPLACWGLLRWTTGLQSEKCKASRSGGKKHYNFAPHPLLSPHA